MLESVGVVIGMKPKVERLDNNEPTSQQINAEAISARA